MTVKTGAIANKFAVNDVELGPPQTTVPVREIEWTTKGKIEARGVTTEQVLGLTGNRFLRAVKLAYDQHYPLVLSPDAIWLVIAQGFSHHVNENAEALRDKFVDHAGKVKIVIDSAGIKGSPWTPWIEAASARYDIPAAARAKMDHQNDAMGCEDKSVLDKFIDELRDRVKGEIVDTIMPTFSTTTVHAHAAMAVTTMATFQNYFEYGMRTLCGIPEVTLLGEVDDWKAVRERAGRLAAYDTDFWLPHLLPVLDKFVESAEGNPDPKFWEQVIQIGGGSGGPYVTGWINTFFPYMDAPAGRSRYQNKHMDWGKGYRMMSGNHPGNFVPSTAVCPFEWNYYGAIYKMEFEGGIVGASQDPHTMAIQPEIGWAVADVTNN
jgi:hypothetical protein